jgi:glycosyltransferase involved in cell wall biosynthesis
VRPFFPLTCDDARLSRADFELGRRASDQWRRHASSIVDGLDAIDQEFGLHDADVVLFNTVRQWSLPGIVKWLESRPMDACPKIAIILHYTSQRTHGQADETTAEYKKALSEIAVSKRAECISLFADSEELAVEFTELSGIPCGVVVIPHVGDIDRTFPRDREISVVAAGPAREDKGFNLLPAALKALNEAQRPGRMIVQGYSFQHGAQVARTITALRRGGATILQDELSNAQFRTLLASADLIVLPYATEYYHSQTSGVFAEALGAGIPVVVPEDTWMARQIAEFGGGLTYDSRDSHGFETAVRIAISKLDLLVSEAQVTRDRWLKKHGARQLLDIVEEAFPAEQGCRSIPKAAEKGGLHR